MLSNALLHLGYLWQNPVQVRSSLNRLVARGDPPIDSNRPVSDRFSANWHFLWGEARLSHDLHDLRLPKRVEQGARWAQWAQPALSPCLEAFIIYSLSLSNNFIAGVRTIFHKFTGLGKATFQAIDSAVPCSFSPNTCVLGLAGLLENACHFVMLQSKHNARMHALQKCEIALQFASAGPNILVSKVENVQLTQNFV